MPEATAPNPPLIHWDEPHVLALVCAPESLVAEEPWGAWIKAQGGLHGVYAALRRLPLAEKQRKTLAVLLAEPGASLQQYAGLLHVSVATYVRYRAALVKTLTTVLNAHLVDKPPARPAASGSLASAATAPDARDTAATPTNLPYERLPLIGRVEALQTVCATLLQSGTGLLTITGPGGIGKTRLAVHAAADLLEYFPHGVFFVSLAAITNPDLVAKTIQQTLNLKTAEAGPGIELLKSYLRDKQLLLVLDNFEQVTAASSLLAELLAAAPGLKILVTSRAVLHVYGEREFGVAPLAVPSVNPLPPLAELAGSPAVALFVSRAAAVRSEFTLTPENAASVAAICARLEGIPLALELAAARIKLFGPAALLRELEHRLTGLAHPSPDRVPRHQTMRNAVAWSYQLLAPAEQALFAQLGVFVGGCTLEAVAAICQRGRRSAEQSLASLAALVDQSMLHHTLRSNGEPRFMLLETLREYAREQLAAQGQLGDLARRHAAYYLAWVEAGEPGPKEPNLAAWLKALEEEHDNLRAALQWALDHGESQIALRLAGAVWRFWQIHGHVEEGAAWLRLILERARDERGLARAKALWGAGWLAMVLGTLPQARAYFEEGATLAHELGESRYHGLALHGLGAVARAQGDFTRARQAFADSLPLFQALANSEDVAWTFEHLGVTALEQGEFDQAVAYLTQGLALFQTLNQRWPCAEALTFLGHAALQQGDYAQAQKRYEEALPIYEELEDRLNSATLNAYIGATLYGRGELARALHLYRSSLAYSLELKDSWSLAWGVERLAEVAEKLDQPAHAARLWGAADALRRTTGVLWHPGFHSYYTARRFAALKAQLGAAEWRRLWDEGQALTPEAVVAHALEAMRSVTSG